MISRIKRWWQPIETAPKDGSLIFVWAPEREGLPAMYSLCRWHPDAGFCIDELRIATHWMPLPAPPGLAAATPVAGSAEGLCTACSTTYCAEHDLQKEIKQMPDWDMNGDVTLSAMRAQVQYAVQALAEMERQRDELLSALKGVIRVADRKTVEFDAARAAIAKAEGTPEARATRFTSLGKSDACHYGNHRACPFTSCSCTCHAEARSTAPAEEP